MPIIAMLFACGSNATMNVNEPLTYDVKIKDNAEFILVKEGTSVDEFTNNLESYLDIDTNADSYTIEYAGEKYSSLSFEEYEKNKNIYDYKQSLEETLNHDSFRPISLYVTFKKDGKTKTDYEQIVLAVARDEEYNAILKSGVSRIEEAYIVINRDIEWDGTGISYVNSAYEDQYVSNIRQH